MLLLIVVLITRNAVRATRLVVVVVVCVAIHSSECVTLARTRIFRLIVKRVGARALPSISGGIRGAPSYAAAQIIIVKRL